MNCTFHPDRPTLLRCTRCGRPACPDCLTDAPVGSQCPACVRGLPLAAPLTGPDAERLAASRDRKARQAAVALRRPGWVFYALVAAFIAVCAGAWAMPMDRADLNAPPVALRAIAIAVVVVGTLLSVTFHEWAHAIVALRGGDTGVVGKGYLTLDFRRYSDPLLSIGFPVLFLLLGGLPLPGGAVWINNGLLRSRWWKTAVSLAGSAMNLAFGLLCAVVVGTGVFETHPVLNGSLAYLAFIQFGVAILNLLPIPGLDGYGAIEPHLPDAVRGAVASIRSYGLFIVVALMMVGELGFIWDLAQVLISLAGVDLGWVGVGATIARPRI